MESSSGFLGQTRNSKVRTMKNSIVSSVNFRTPAAESQESIHASIIVENKISPKQELSATKTSFKLQFPLKEEQFDSPCKPQKPSQTTFKKS
jgi:hypothetical protein